MPPLITLSVADVRALHIEVMERTGFPPAPVRDENLLEAAMMRPQMAAHYEQADLVRQAALLATGISQAQAFVDGNKRTAYAACDVFLRINRFVYSGAPVELARQLELVAERSDTISEATDRFEAWLRKHVKPI